MALGPTRVIHAARLLLQARGDFRQIPGFPEDCRPEDMDDAYLVQKAFAEEWELPVAGWKIGCTAKAQQKMLGVKEPFYGRVFGPFLKESPAEMSGNAFHEPGLECEFAFRIKRDVRPRSKPFEVEDVEKLVAAFHPAIEIVDRRISNWLTRGGPSIVADNGANGALVIGPAIKKWAEHDLAKAKVTLAIDGEQVAKGAGRLALGHPIKALAWLVNTLSEEGITLEKDQVVTTGTCTGLVQVRPGITALADFGKLGQVEITLSG